jgi:hypothetical protein
MNLGLTVEIVVRMGSSEGCPLDRPSVGWYSIWLGFPHSLRKSFHSSSVPYTYPNTQQLSATTYLVDVYGEKFGSSAIAANGILRFGFGAAFPLFTVQMYEGLGVHWAGSVFAFAALLMMPVPWVFFKWGKNLRERSRYVIEGALSD